MNKEIEILVDGKPTKMKLPTDMQDSKIFIKNDKVFAEIGVVDYINNLKEENQRLNNVLKLKTDFIAELLKIILVSRDYELQDKCEIRAKMYEEKLQKLKESDK